MTFVASGVPVLALVAALVGMIPIPSTAIAQDSAELVNAALRFPDEGVCTVRSGGELEGEVLFVVRQQASQGERRIRLRYDIYGQLSSYQDSASTHVVYFDAERGFVSAPGALLTLVTAAEIRTAPRLGPPELVADYVARYCGRRSLSMDSLAVQSLRSLSATLVVARGRSEVYLRRPQLLSPDGVADDERYDERMIRYTPGPPGLGQCIASTLPGQSEVLFVVVEPAHRLIRIVRDSTGGLLLYLDALDAGTYELYITLLGGKLRQADQIMYGQREAMLQSRRLGSPADIIRAVDARCSAQLRQDRKE